MSDFSEETFGRDRRRTNPFIYDRENDRQIELSEEGDVHGYEAGQRIRFSDACYELLAGREATILGFSPDGRVWTQIEGFDSALWTLDEQVPEHFESVPSLEVE
jgi:hypothetical protein